MRIKIKLLCLVAVAVFPVLLIACGSPGSAPASTPVTPTPDRQAALSALDRARAEFVTPTPTPVPPAVRSVAQDFVKGHLAITRDWQQFHNDFDRWREELTACDASSVQVKLREFAGRSGSTTEATRGLSRLPVVKELTDKLIAATEKEEAAVRLLRDTWQPDKPSVFEPVEVARSAASARQKEVDDGLRELQERATAASRSQVEAFSKAFQRLNSSWDEFHKNYDSFRSRQSQLASAEVANQLGEIVAQFKDIVVAVRELPTSSATRQVSQMLAEAATDEDLALRKLRGVAEKEGGRSAAKGSSAVGEFDAFEAQVVKSNAARRQALQELAGVRQDVSEESGVVLRDFARQYGLLLQQWNAFHKEYDDWRRSEGGCDRAKAIGKLGEFTLRFGELTTRVRGLPRAAFLRPLGETLVEAAEREERALRALRNTWRPFDAEVYKSLDQERTAAAKLRRQAAIGIQDLVEQYGISAQELGK